MPELRGVSPHQLAELDRAVTPATRIALLRVRRGDWEASTFNPEVRARDCRNVGRGATIAAAIDELLLDIHDSHLRGLRARPANTGARQHPSRQRAHSL